MKQTITVVLDLREGQQPYKLREGSGYEALLYFFEDIGYKVGAIEVGEDPNSREQLMARGAYLGQVVPKSEI